MIAAKIEKTNGLTCEVTCITDEEFIEIMELADQCGAKLISYSKTYEMPSELFSDEFKKLVGENK